MTYQPDKFWNIAPAIADSLFGSQLMVAQYGIGQWKKGLKMVHHRRPVLAVEVVTGGEMEFNQNGKIYSLKEGDVGLFRRNTVITMKTGSCDYVNKQMVLLIGNRLLDSVLTCFNLYECDVIHVSDLKNLLRLFSEVREVLENQSSNNAMELSSLGYQILAELGKWREAETIPVQFIPLLDYMKRHCRAKLTLKDLANRAGMSPSHFTRKFYKLMNCTPISYFIGLKLDYAKFLLSSTTHSIQEIAAELSYNNSNFFSRQFKTVIGMSPTQYRRESKPLGNHSA